LIYWYLYPKSISNDGPTPLLSSLVRLREQRRVLLQTPEERAVQRTYGTRVSHHDIQDTVQYSYIHSRPAEGGLILRNADIDKLFDADVDGEGEGGTENDKDLSATELIDVSNGACGESV
jgi:hypothetical protein